MDLGWAVHVRASAAAAAMCSTVGATLVGLIAGNTTPPAAIYRGACDASAAVAVDADHFAVADDEDPSNTLRVYRFGEPRPVSTTPTSAFLSARAEVDIEGAEQIGDLIYWIGSHARTSKNKASPDRRRLFATRLSYHGRTPVLTPTGIPYDHLLEDFANARPLENLGVTDTMNLPPESAGGLNIEALGHQGTTLLIGFRSPQIRANALVVAVENPQELVSIEGTRARLGAVTLLPLGGRGIRGMATLPDSTIVLIAGPADDRRDFELFGWRGTGPVVRKLGPVDFGTLHPEALVVRRSGAVYAVSDDGAEFVNGKPCHALSFQEPEASRKQFRVVKLLR